MPKNHVAVACSQVSSPVAVTVACNTLSRSPAVVSLEVMVSGSHNPSTGWQIHLQLVTCSLLGGDYVLNQYHNRVQQQQYQGPLQQHYIPQPQQTQFLHFQPQQSQPSSSYKGPDSSNITAMTLVSSGTDMDSSQLTLHASVTLLFASVPPLQNVVNHHPSDCLYHNDCSYFILSSIFGLWLLACDLCNCDNGLLLISIAD